MTDTFITFESIYNQAGYGQNTDVNCHRPSCGREIKPEEQRVCVNGKQDYHWHCFLLQFIRQCLGRVLTEYRGRFASSSEVNFHYREF